MSAVKGCAVLFLLALVSSVSCACKAKCPGQMDADVLILGAGMAGLGAAETLSQKGIDNFLIIEQGDKVGGRVQTAEFGGGFVELGPQWVLRTDADPTDMRHPLYEYVNRCNIALRDTPFGSRGAINYNRNGDNIGAEVGREIAACLAALAPDIVQSILATLPEDEDISVSQGLRIGGWNPRTELQEHVEHLLFDAPNSFPASRSSYRDTMDPDLNRLRFNQFADTPVNRAVIDPEGLFAIPKCIADGFLAENDSRLILQTAIVEIEWSDDCVCAISRAGARFCALYAILTFSIGELQNPGFVRFSPALPPIKTITLNQLELGHFLKIYVEFNETFWDTDVDFINYSNELRGSDYYPIFVTWGTQFPEPTNVLEAFVHGLDESKRIAYQDPEITRQEIAQVMRDIYGERASEPIDIIIADFVANPYFFGNIFAAHVGYGRRQSDEMNTPCGNLYFSGDAITFDIHGTLHGALLHGRETATRICEILQGPLNIDFINDTPRVEGSTITAEFRTSKQADSIECILIPSAEIRVDCSSCQFSVSDLADGLYSLRVVAKANGTEKAVVGRKLTVNTGETACHAHLLNDVSVNGGRATIEFSSSGLHVSGFQCSLDFAPPESCESPLVLTGLAPGDHRVRIDPVCECKTSRVVARFEVEE